MDFIYIIAIVILFVMTFGLRSRVNNLESKNKNAVPANTIPVAQAVVGEAPRPVVQTAPSAVPSPDKQNAFIQWFKEDWLLKFGVLILIIGFLWFVSYAFAENWIGPVGRITLGIIAGILAMVVAEWRVRSHPKQGGAFFILGSGVLFITLFAATHFYGMFSPLVTLSMMFLVSLYVALVSVRYNMKSLAVVSLVLSFISPVLVGIRIPSADKTVQIYLLLVVLSTVWVTAIKGWRVLTTLSLFGVALYGFAYMEGWSMSRDAFLPFVYVFVSIFFLTNIFGYLKDKVGKNISDIFTTGLNTLFLLAWVLVAVPEHWKSLALVLWAVIFAVASFIVYRFTGKKAPFLAYALSSMTLIATATAVELSGPALLVAYMFEIALVSVGTFLVTKSRKLGEFIAVLMVLPGIWVIPSMFSLAWRKGFLHEDFFVALLYVVIVALLALLYYFVEKSETNSDSKKEKGYSILFIIASVFGYVLLWQTLHSGKADQDIATLMSLVIYTIIGLATNIMGKIKENLYLRYYGGILIGVVIVRLFFVDVWDMDLAGKVITFFAIGILLISTAFIGRHKKQIQ